MRIPNSKSISQAPSYQETTNFAKGFFSNIAIGRDGQLGQAMLHILLSHIALCHTFHLYCFSLEQGTLKRVKPQRGTIDVFPLHQYDFLHIRSGSGKFPGYIIYISFFFGGGASFLMTAPQKESQQLPDQKFGHIREEGLVTSFHANQVIPIITSHKYLAFLQLFSRNVFFFYMTCAPFGTFAPWKGCDETSCCHDTQSMSFFMETVNRKQTEAWRLKTLEKKSICLIFYTV